TAARAGPMPNFGPPPAMKPIRTNAGTASRPATQRIGGRVAVIGPSTGAGRGPGRVHLDDLLAVGIAVVQLRVPGDADQHEAGRGDPRLGEELGQLLGAVDPAGPELERDDDLVH